MAKRLDDTEALSTQAANDLSEIETIIQEQAKPIEEKEKEGISDALISKYRKVLQLRKILNGKSELIQIWRKGLRTTRRYQLEQ